MALREAPSSRRWSNFPGVARMSLGFMAVFASYTTTQNMMPWLLQQLGFGRLGFVSLMTVYGFFFLSCALIPPLLKQVNARHALPVASLTYALSAGAAALVASGVLQDSAAKCMLMLASAVNGIGVSGLWCCQGVIMTHYAPPELLNRYIAFFLVCWQLGPLSGAVLARILLESMTTANAFLVLCGLSLVGSAIMTGLPKPEKNADTPPEPAIVAKPFREVRGEMQQRLRRPLQLLSSDRRAVHITCLSFMHGACLNAFPSAVFSQCAGASHPADSDIMRRRVAAALACLGVGSTLASLAFAPLTDRLGRRTSLGCVCLTIMLATSCFELEAVGIAYVHAKVSYLNMAAFALGLANMYCRGSLLSSIISLYKSDSVYAVVAMQFGTSIGTVFGFLAFPWLSLHSNIALGLGGYALGALAAVVHRPMFDTGLPMKAQ